MSGLILGMPKTPCVLLAPCRALVASPPLRSARDGEDLIAVMRTIIEQTDPNAPIRERVDTFNRIAGRFLDSRALLIDKPKRRRLNRCQRI